MVGLFAATNIGIAAAYHGRTYPQTRVMDTAIGSVAYGNLSQKISDLKLLPASITLVQGQQKATVTLHDVGVSKDVSRTTHSANKERYWLPIVNLFKSPQLEAPVAIRTATLTKEGAKLSGKLSVPASDAHLDINEATVSITGASDGRILDQSRLEQSILRGLDAGRTSIAVATKLSKPQVQASSLQTAKQALQAQIDTKLVFSYNGKTKQPTAQEIAGWYARAGTGYDLSTAKIDEYVASLDGFFGIRIKDANTLVSTTVANIKAAREGTLAVAAQTAVKTYTYCTAVRGVSTSNLTALQAKLKSTYADPRGWSLNGLVDFKQATSGCDFTVWISAADQMTSFGGVCDAIWSCRSGDNVVFNYNRWANASDAWNASGGTLDDYRSMLINHETGHRLGFAHRHCGGAGQLAPVMQQQSINLEGCVFNPWPVKAELDTLRSNLGL